MSTKQDELDIIDTNIRRLLIEATREGGDTSTLPELNTCIQYLSKNNVISEKAKSSKEDEIKLRVKEAEKRRAKNDK